MSRKPLALARGESANTGRVLRAARGSGETRSLYVMWHNVRCMDVFFISCFEFTKFGIINKTPPTSLRSATSPNEGEARWHYSAYI